MGWTSYHAQLGKDGKIDRKAECGAYFLEGLNKGHYRILKSAMVGRVYYAAVQNLTRYMGEDEAGKAIYAPVKDGKVWAVVILTSVNRKEYYNFAYKPMDEGCGPCYYDCPASILNLLSETDNEFAKEWRKKCWETIKKKKDPNALHNLQAGSVIEFVSAYDMDNGVKKGDIVSLTKKKRFGIGARTFWSDGQYKWSCRIIPDDYKIVN